MATESWKRVLISKVVYGLLRFILSPLKSARHIDGAIYGCLRAISRKTNNFVMFTQKPILTESINYKPLSNNDLGSLAIIIQGPVKHENNFTLETVKLYQRHFKNAKIIVSTWDDEDTEALEKLNITVIKSRKPEDGGVGNINMQTLSSITGLKEASRKNCLYSMKTRSDQRLYRTDIFQFFMALMKEFPLENPYMLRQKERIIFSQGTFPNSMLIPYHICDFFFFGLTDDLISYLDYDMETFMKITKRLPANKKPCVGEHFAMLAPEMMYPISYLGKQNVIVDVCNLGNSWEFITSYMIPVSLDDLNLLWYKYVRNCNESTLKNDYRSDDDTHFSTYTYNWTFKNWLCVRNKTIIMTREMAEFPLNEFKYTN